MPMQAFCERRSKPGLPGPKPGPHRPKLGSESELEPETIFYQYFTKKYGGGEGT
jgi:hypothetical protein